MMMLRMRNENDATRSIAVLADNQEWIQRVVSKLLIGGSRWSVQWSENDIHIETTDAQMKCLAKYLTNPTFLFMLSESAESRFSTHSNWVNWKEDRRFHDYLLTDEHFENLKQEIYVSLQNNTFSLVDFLQTSKEVQTILIKIDNELQTGSISEKLIAGGYM